MPSPAESSRAPRWTPWVLSLAGPCGGAQESGGAPEQLLGVLWGSLVTVRGGAQGSTGDHWSGSMAAPGGVGLGVLWGLTGGCQVGSTVAAKDC